MFSIYYFIDQREKIPVEEFIDSLTEKEQTKVFAYLHELSEKGFLMRRPMADYLGEGIYELRPKCNRIFYFFFLGANVVLLHAIKKNTQQIPYRDFKLCIVRKLLVELGNSLRKLEMRGE